MKPPHYPTEPHWLWEHFYQITRIPRPSKAEAAVRQYVIELAEQGGHAWQADAEGNLVVTIAATPGKQGSEPVVIQNHLDMVTVKTGDKVHDFFSDPLDLQIIDGWLQGDRTTLGADNGLGCAAALALLSDPDVVHPALELLFTVDEETGLGGALNLDASLLSGTRMLNLDTEDWNELYVGCAGGGGWEFTRQFNAATIDPAWQCWSLELKGLAGGHSGIQIHQQLGNAIKMLAQCLQEFGGIRLASFSAGVAHNVIPREGRVTFACASGREAELTAAVDTLRVDWLTYLPAADGALAMSLAADQTDESTFLAERDTTAILGLIAAFPHGAQSYSLAQPADLVDLSINLAVLQLDAGSLYLESSYRFFNEDQSRPLQQSVIALAEAFALTVTPAAGYPGWQPDFESPLLAQASALHQRLFGDKPAVKAIHAGLECGILKSKKPEMDILSFGPTIRGAHSPTERLKIDTVAPFWQLLTALLAEM